MGASTGQQWPQSVIPHGDLEPPIANDDGDCPAPLAIRQDRSNFGRGVPNTAIAATTSSQNGSTPNPGIASRASPGSSSHWRPKTKKSSSAVPISTTHTIGGKGVAKAPMASEAAAIAKARASRFLENLRASEDGALTLVGCLPGSCGSVI